MEHLIKKIDVYDFDGSLAISPENTQENRILWEKIKGRPWPHKGNGWWSKLESLDNDVFDIKLNSDVFQDALKSIKSLETYSVLLTGRIPRFSSIVKKICRNNGLPYFDAYFFNDMSDTLKFKLAKLEYLKNEFPFVKYFEIWEDRLEHIPFFEEWGYKNYGSNFKMNIIK